MGRLFRQFSWFQGFLSYFPALGFCRSRSCLGLVWFLVFLSIPLLGFSVTSSRCGVSHLLTWSLFLSVPRFLYLDGSSSVLLGGVQPSPHVPRFSRGWPTRAISILRLSLFCSALRVLLLLAFDPLGWLLLLSPYPWSFHSFCWSVPTLPSWSVGPPGSPRLALPLRSGVLLPGCTCSVSSVCINLASFLSCSSGVLRPGGCFPWVVSSSMVVFILSSHVRPLWSCHLLPVSSLASPPWSWFCCFLRLRFVRRLSPSVVFLVPSRWGHPGMGRM